MDINYDTDISSSVNASHKLYKITGSVSGFTRPDNKALKAWGVTGASTSNFKEFPQFRSLSADGNTLTLIVSASGIAKISGSHTVGYLQETTAANRGDFEDRVGNATVDQLGIPEVNLEMRSLPIVAKTR